MPLIVPPGPAAPWLLGAWRPVQNVGDQSGAVYIRDMPLAVRDLR